MEYEQGIYIVKSYFKIFFPVLLYSAVHTLDLFQLKTSIIILHIIYFVLISKHLFTEASKIFRMLNLEA